MDRARGLLRECEELAAGESDAAVSGCRRALEDGGVRGKTDVLTAAALTIGLCDAYLADGTKIGLLAGRIDEDWLTQVDDDSGEAQFERMLDLIDVFRETVALADPGAAAVDEDAGWTSPEESRAVLRKIREELSDIWLTTVSLNLGTR